MLIHPAVRHPTLAEKLVDHVFEKIVRGELHPGERITEERLAADFGASRTPVREAIRRLAEMGVVVVRSRARLEVASADPLEMIHIHQVREVLECMAVRLMMDRLRDEDVRVLADLVRRCERAAKAGNRVEAFRDDSRFHLAIAERSGNRCLYDLLARLDVKVQMCRAFSCVSMAKIRTSVAFHRHILDAIESRDVDAAQQRMREHIQRTVETNHTNGVIGAR